jgi:hypothetical protein
MVKLLDTIFSKWGYPSLEDFERFDVLALGFDFFTFLGFLGSRRSSLGGGPMKTAPYIDTHTVGEPGRS